MAWQFTKGGNAKFTYIDPLTGKVFSKIFRKGPVAKVAIKSLSEQRERNRKIIAESYDLESKLDSLEILINQIIDQHLTCSGLIKRQCVWQRVSRLNKQLTPEERNYIRRIKSKVNRTQNDKN